MIIPTEANPFAPWPHPACLPDEELVKQCTLGRGRAGGPGGQNRNKVETLVTIKHDTTGHEAHAGERRSQGENREMAIRRLRLILATQLRCPPPPPPRSLDAILGPSGSELWRSRRAGGKIACNPDHIDYPSLLAEALDVVAECGWDAPKAAERLEVTTSQLIKLVKDHRPAFNAWNVQRARRGLHGLK